MKLTTCSKCGRNRVGCAMTGRHGAWVCQRCLYEASAKLGDAVVSVQAAGTVGSSPSEASDTPEWVDELVLAAEACENEGEWLAFLTRSTTENQEQG